MVCSFGVTQNGKDTSLYILRNSRHMEAAITDYGAALVWLYVPDRKGHVKDVALGYDDVSGYEKGSAFLGATVGRVANRIGGASFTLNGDRYKLTKNDNGNNLHSGPDIYNKRVWNVEEVDEKRIVLALVSPDKDQGYPGELKVRVSYTLTEENELEIYYDAVAEADTLVNMTNHSYFNLSGHDSGNVLDQKVWIDADAYTKADKESVPTGEITPVVHTPMDFREEKAIGQDIAEDYEALIFGNGYDHNWVLNGSGFRKTASMYSNQTGIKMEVYTDLPGMQFYTGNFLMGEQGKNGVTYSQRQGACFETQYFPDAVNIKTFQSPVIKAGEVYESRTVYKFV